MQTAIDHLVVAGATLEAARDHLERGVAVASQPGGHHALMGTHNRLLSLGPALYAEALAPDPEAAPDRPRWFGLDGLVRAGEAPRLAGWVLRVDDLDARLAHAPEGIGRAIAMQRDGERWRISVPDDGVQPFDGLFPALISWDSAGPAAALPDSGATLAELVLSHPDPGRLSWALALVCDDDRVTVREGPPGLAARIETREGERVLT